MIEKTCSMCPYKIAGHSHGDPLYGQLLRALFDSHVDDHVSDFRIEMELMSF